jgi:hypothetical protein
MMIRRLVPLCLLIACVLLLYQRLAFSGLILARGDAFSYFYPYWEVRSEAFRAGQLPLWSPDLFMGVPLLADPQIGTYYPPNWAVTPLAVPDAVRVSILAHVMFAAFGAYWLFRRTQQNSSRWAALVAGVLYGGGGFIGAHVEQINQLQGLAWMPWLFGLLHGTLAAWLEQRQWHRRIRGLLALLILAGALAIQVYSGHTQTVFMSGVGLGLYALVYGLFSQGQRLHPPTRFVRMGGAVVLLGTAVIIAVLLALPQLLPSMELTGLSIRGGRGFTAPQATAFSLPPTYLGRTLLPSYDGLLFGEYIGTVGVIGLGLMLWGLFAPDTREWRRQRWAWLVVAGIGLFFAAGRYNPLYYTISEWPGFNLFRVPARWMALFSIGSAMLAGLGVQALIPLFEGKQKSALSDNTRAWYTLPRHFARSTASSFADLTFSFRTRLMLVVAALLVFALATRFITIIAPEDMTGSYVPTPKTMIAWALAGAALIGLFVLPLGRWRGAFACVIVIAELWGASLIMPYNDLAPRDVYEQQHFTVSQLYAWREGDVSVGRIMPITRLYFDPGDKTQWDARFAQAGMDLSAVDSGYTALKKQEVVSSNLPITWHIPSIDGYGGGILPTMAYSQWTSLLMPDGMMRVVDGRLSEALAQPTCRGACVPDEEWLEAAGVDYLILDKTQDVWVEGIAYDTAFAGTNAETYLGNAPFYTDSVYVLHQGDLPITAINDEAVTWEKMQDTPDGTISRVLLVQPKILDHVTFTGEWADGASLIGVTLVNTQNKLFQQTVPQGWIRRLSSDIKIYTPPASQTRSAHEPYVAFSPLVRPDDWNGSEEAVRALSADPTADVILSNGLIPIGEDLPRYSEGVKMTQYGDTEITISITDNPQEGYLIIKDAWYPGWTATVNGQTAPVSRANVMFRAVFVPEGDSIVILSFQPVLWTQALQIGVVMWALWGVGVVLLGVAWRRMR